MSTQDDDEAILHRLGYAQVLYRERGGFGGWYLLSARKWFTGPVREAGTEQELTDIEQRMAL